MTNSNTRDSFIFYRSFYEAINHLPEDQQLQIYKAISSYSLDFKDVNLEGIPNAIFTLIKPQLEANRKRYLNGIKEKKISKPEAKRKQTRSKTEANKNVNHNVNVECKLINKNKELIESQFEELWNEYKILHTPKGNKEKALDKFKKLLSKNKFEDIIRGTKTYIKNCHTKNIYTKQVISFLNGETWKEYLEIDTQSNTEQHTTDLINKLMNHTLIKKIELTRSNKAKLYTTKKGFDDMGKLDEKLKEDIKNLLTKELGTSGLEFNY
jgi:hypothetical protein